METYYHSDSRIEEWVKQIIETIFTTCLLSGNDSEVEFQKGCQIVEKLTTLLQGFPTLPSEYVADGLQQIIEQQLPDSRVINNFPSFKNTMNKMLQEGMLKVINTQNNSSIIIDEAFNEEDYPIQTNQEIPALAPVFNIEEEKIEQKEDQNNKINCLEQPETIKEQQVCLNSSKDADTAEDNGHKTVPISLNNNDEKQPNLVPTRAERLNDVLKHIFPQAHVLWNITLLEENFLAQVEDTLIFIKDSARTCETVRLMNNGWRIVVLEEEDLSFPRRLERKIKRHRRS